MESMPGSLSADEIIAAVDGLSQRELARVHDHVLATQAGRRAPHLSGEESSLLARINEGLPPVLGERLSLLRARREEGSITGDEYDELTRLTDRAEELDAARMGALAELARLRGTSLTALMDRLGIRLPENA